MADGEEFKGPLTHGSSTCVKGFIFSVYLELGQSNLKGASHGLYFFIMLTDGCRGCVGRSYIVKP